MSAEFNASAFQIAASLFDELSKGNPKPVSINFGLAPLDQAFGEGLRPGSLTLLGARPRMATTQFLAQIALHTARQGHRVTVLTGRETPEEWIWRCLSLLSGERLTPGSSRSWGEDELVRHAATLKELDLPLELRAGEEGSDSLAALLDERAPPRLLIVDDPEEAGQWARAEVKHSLAARGCACLASASVIAGVDRRANKRPGFADLKIRDRALENIDCVIHLYRDERYNPDSPDRGRVECYSSLNRMGEEFNACLDYTSSGAFNVFDPARHQEKCYSWLER